jgi:hypothetical protein
MTSPSSYRPLQLSERDKLAMKVMRATVHVNGPDGEPVDVAEALPGSAFRCRIGVFRKTLILWFVSPPEPPRIESARQAAGEWRVKARVDRKGRPQQFLDGGGTAGVREPRRPLKPSDSAGAAAEETAE